MRRGCVVHSASFKAGAAQAQGGALQGAAQRPSFASFGETAVGIPRSKKHFVLFSNAATLRHG
eukprot:1655569-Prymnesium_polylepis.1